MDQETAFDSPTLQPTSPGHSAASMPVFLTSFVGREQDVSSVAELLHSPDVRLVTITGFGGIGKTRLAVAVAEQSADCWRRRWFVSLAHTTESNAVQAQIITELGIDFERATATDPTVRQDLLGFPCLLVLDNLEQVPNAAEHVSSLLRTWSHLHILVTSRGPLQLSAEHVYMLQPLDCAISNDASHLFVDRARAHMHDIVLPAEASLSWKSHDGGPLGKCAQFRESSMSRRIFEAFFTMQRAIDTFLGRR